PFTQKEYFRDADATRLTNGQFTGQLRLVHVDRTVLHESPTSSGFNLLDMRFSGSTGTLVTGGTTGYLVEPIPALCVGQYYGLSGCALSTDGSAVYLTGESSTDCTSDYSFLKKL